MGTHFTKDERNELSILLKKGHSQRDIEQALNKDHSSISRETTRNSVKGIYDPNKAHHKSRVRRTKSKYQNMKICESLVFESYLEQKLKAGWTPEEISGRWKRDNPREKRFSFKSVYKYLYSIYGQRLCKYLPSRRYNRRKRSGKRQKRLPVKNRVSIDKRPKTANERVRFGDFEGDVLGSKRTTSQRLPALVERKTRKLFAIKVHRLKNTMDGFKYLLKPYHDIVKSVTFDNGPENARHLELRELGIKTYFCDPFASWQKGTVENTLGRLRRFIKKRSSLNQYSDKDVHGYIERMNNTPRKCLDFRTPNEVFNELLAKARKRRAKLRKGWWCI